MLTLGGISGRFGTERDVTKSAPRVDSENHVVGVADRGVRSSVVRLPSIVHSNSTTSSATPWSSDPGRRRRLLKWDPIHPPAHPGLVPDLEERHYFEAALAS